MNNPLIVSETILNVHAEYNGTIGQPLLPTESPYAEFGEVALRDGDDVRLVPVMHTLPDSAPVWDAAAYDALNY